MSCVRCGGDFQIEKHHIVHKINGGKDIKDNMVELCRHCHKYQHAKERLLDNLISYLNGMRLINKLKRKRIGFFISRVELTLKRLEVLESENTPLQIASRGYYKYWNNEDTHQ